MPKRTSKRVVVIADMHCGHRAGLTPPAWQLRPTKDPDEPAERQREKWATIQAEAWAFYRKEMTRLRPIDILIVNGDCIDGTGSRSGGIELITTDRNKQIDMALRCINLAKANKVRLVRGTPYHTGEQEDMEDTLASLLNCKIGDHEWYEINGVTFDVKHFVNPSSIPHGRATPLAKQKLWNELWALEEDQPLADILIRSHVHYHLALGGTRKGKKTLALITPALQAMGTRYGARICSGTVDFGFYHFEIDGRGQWAEYPHITKLQSQRAHAERL